MNLKVQILQLILFFGLFQSQADAKYLTYGQGFDGQSRLKIIKIENETENQEFQIFNGFDSSSGFVAARTAFNFDKEKEVGLSSTNLLTIKCCKGSYVPVFLQDGVSSASGEVDEGFEGPFFVSMWLSIPNISESGKIRVRYQLKKNSIGKIGIRIGKQGDYRLVAYENVKFIEN